MVALCHIREFSQFLAKLRDPSLLIVLLYFAPEGHWVLLVDALAPQVLGHVVHHHILSLFLQPDVNLMTGDLVFDLLEVVLAGIVVADVVAPVPPVIFKFGLAERTDACGSILRRMEWIRPRW
jgi:hypothetical protein